MGRNRDSLFNGRPEGMGRFLGLPFAALALAVLAGQALACGRSFCIKKETEPGPGIAAFTALAAAGGTEEKPAATDKETAKEQWITLKVKGMTCGSCEFQVKRALKKLEGVKEAKASSKEGTARVLYDTGKVKPNDLVEAINKAGYHPSLPQASGKEG